MVELVDWCRYLVAKEPTGVTSVSHAAPPHKKSAHKNVGDGDAAGNDYQAISLDFSDPERPGTGPLAQIFCNQYFPEEWHEAIHYRTPAALQIVCQNGIAFLDLPATLIWYDEAGRHQESLEHERPVGEQLFTHFYRAVTSLVRDRTDLEEAYRALVIVQQAKKSAADGQRIMLNRVFH